MLTCPKCGSEMAEGANFCEECGYRFGEAGETKVMPKPSSAEQSAKKPFYKRPVVIAAVVIAAFLLLSCCVAASIWFFLLRQEGSGYENQVKKIWEEVISESNQLKKALDKTSTQDDLEELSSANLELADLLKDKQEKVEDLGPPAKYKNSQSKLEDFLEKYIEYLTAAQKVIDNPLEVNLADNFAALKQLSLADDFVALEQLSNDAKSAGESFVEKTDFIDEDVPEEVFEMPSVLRELVKKIQAKKAAEEKAKKEKQLKEQRAADEAAVKDTVINFMQAYINAQAAACRKYLTSRGNGDFNTDLEFSGDFDRVDFKITSLKRASSTKYEVYGTEYDRSWEGESFTTEWLFEVIKTGGKWLIDRRTNLGI